MTTGGRAGIFGGRFVLFADVLYLGVLVFLASLPVVTAFAAVTAGSDVLRDRIRRDGTFTIGRYLRRVGDVVRAQKAVLLAPVGVLVVFLLNTLALVAGMPGAEFYRPMLLGIAAVGAVIGLRVALAWSEESSWTTALRDGATTAVRDPGGSALLLGALVAAVVIIGQTWLMLPLVTGMVLFASVAVSLRERS
ncbi:hypothetical protein FHR81_005031 [Actinoalloteichus hoggarensis]|uniref:hypothetical protein n=1 Tax=Actinoalloteichus hoggarensis TaxID=1470176 RepID=UPI0012FE03D1|nr:hypothetical protein [Actinoalloteichus hoggarensis]MBB5923958.1 hypothetical protein [Actinoalloteichus hoggarensis]